jgi:hypothetical protein
MEWSSVRAARADPAGDCSASVPAAKLVREHDELGWLGRAGARQQLGLPHVPRGDGGGLVRALSLSSSALLPAASSWSALSPLSCASSGMETWTTNSIIRHAVSSTGPAGPYQPREVIMQP